MIFIICLYNLFILTAFLLIGANLIAVLNSGQGKPETGHGIGPRQRATGNIASMRDMSEISLGPLVAPRHFILPRELK